MYSLIQKIAPIPLDTAYPFLLTTSGLFMNEQKKDVQYWQNEPDLQVGV